MSIWDNKDLPIEDDFNKFNKDMLNKKAEVLTLLDSFKVKLELIDPDLARKVNEDVANIKMKIVDTYKYYG